MADKIFISYRRDDAAPWAGRLHMALGQRLDRGQLFIDVDNIQAGADFVKAIEGHVGKCDVLLAVIGGDWLEARNEAGRRRIDDPNDFVRLEIETALRRNIRVVPVLVDGASMPRADDLPEGLRSLARRQSVEVSHAQFGSDLDTLCRSLGIRARLAAQSPDGVLPQARAAGFGSQIFWFARFVKLDAVLAIVGIVFLFMAVEEPRYRRNESPYGIGAMASFSLAAIVLLSRWWVRAKKSWKDFNK